MAVETALSVVQGQTYSMEVTYEIPGVNPGDDPIPQDISNYRARMTVRTRNSQSTPIIIDLTSDDGGGLTIQPLAEDGTTVRLGVVVVRVSAQLMALLTKSTYWYDLFIIDLDDPTNALRLVHGTMTVDQSTTSVLPLVAVGA